MLPFAAEGIDDSVTASLAALSHREQSQRKRVIDHAYLLVSTKLYYWKCEVIAVTSQGMDNLYRVYYTNPLRNARYTL